MITHLAGLPFESSSPSCYRLVLPQGATADVLVTYLGDLWCVMVADKGEATSHCFDTRDAAVAVLVEALGPR